MKCSRACHVRAPLWQQPIKIITCFKCCIWMPVKALVFIYVTASSLSRSLSLAYILRVASGCRLVPPYSHYTRNPITSAFSIRCRRLSPWKLLRHHGSQDERIPLWWKYVKVQKSPQICAGPNFSPCVHSAGKLHVDTDSQHLPLQSIKKWSVLYEQLR